MTDQTEQNQSFFSQIFLRKDSVRQLLGLPLLKKSDGTSAASGKKRFRINANKLSILLTIAALISCIATYAAFTETPPFGDDPKTVIWLLNLDLILLLLLLSLIARRIVSLWSGRRRGIAGSRLHVRLVFIFSLLTATPAIIMTIFSAYFLQFGVDSWFNERVKTAVTESQAVAEAYLEEHQQAIRADILAMANDLDRHTALIFENPTRFEKIMQNQSLLRNLSEAIVFDASGRVLVKSGLFYSMQVDSIPEYALNQAIDGEVVVMTGASDNRVHALIKLQNMIGGYLFVGRMVDPQVLRHLNDTKNAVEEYVKLEGERSGLQLTMTMMFVVIALLLLFAAIWLGIAIARQIVTPISALIIASDRVRSGDLTARVSNFETKDEFDVLGRAFNKMTSQIQQQRDDLIDANRQLDSRRRFSETVLAGVSSGVIGIDKNSRITIANTSAAQLFESDISEIVGTEINQIISGIDEILEKAYNRRDKITQAELPYYREDGSLRTLLMRVAVESIDTVSNDEDNAPTSITEGAVLTFDDITELQVAQRNAAWADVARRIAHEIKNPLTPIQLSAERLNRKYLKQIEEDPDTFTKCTETIIHHVGDIGKMVDEFSSFARMPEPKLRMNKPIRHILDQAVMLKEAHRHIAFNTVLGDQLLAERDIICDMNQIRQAFTNILQNALDSVQTKVDTDGIDGKICILIFTDEAEENVYISVNDNGLGLPENYDKSSLLEPYITHKEKGTGLGLAIVNKIMDDHSGEIIMGTTKLPEAMTSANEFMNGATVSLSLPLMQTHDID